MRAQIRRVFVLVVLLCCLLPALPALADSSVNATTGPSMAVRVGFDGSAKLGSWMPVQVDVANEGPDIAGRVDVQFENNSQSSFFGPTAAVYSVPATFPQHSRKRLVLDVPVPAALRNNRVQVRLLSGDQTILQIAQEFTPIGSGTLLCGVLNQALGAYDFLSTLDVPGRQQTVKVADLTLADLPSQAAELSSLDCLVVGDVDLSAITSAQKAALTAWIGHGGLLVATGGPNWQLSLPDLPANTLPVHPSALAALNSIAPLDQFAHTPPSGSGPWAAVRASLDNGAVVAGDAATPLLAVRRFGSGNVFFYALDPTQEPARGWAGNTFLWQYMLGYSNAAVAVNALQQSFAEWGQTPLNALAALPDLNPPAPWWLLLVMAGYVVVLGPVAFLAFRRLDRREWVLGLVPLLAIAGTAFTIHLAQARQGSDVAVTEVTLMRAEAGSPVALTHTYVGLFSPRPQTVDVQLPAGALVAPTRSNFGGLQGTGGGGQPRTPVQVSEGTGVFVPALQLGPGSMSVFTVDAQSLIGGGITGQLTADGQFVRGQLQNKTGQRISDAYLVLGDTAYSLGTLNVNDTRAVSVPIPSAPSGGTAPGTRGGSLATQLYPSGTASGTSRTANDPHRDVLDRAFASSAIGGPENTGGLLFVGWVDHGPVQVDVHRARAAVRQLTLFESGIALALDPATKSVPAGLLEERPLVRLGVTQSQAGRFSIASGGSLGLQFDLPAQAQLGAQALHLLVSGSYSGGNTLSPGDDLGPVSVYNWASGTWQNVPLAAGDNVVQPAVGLISPTGVVRLRYSFKAPAGSSAGGIDFSRFALSVVRSGA